LTAAIPQSSTRSRRGIAAMTALSVLLALPSGAMAATGSDDGGSNLPFDVADALILVAVAALLGLLALALLRLTGDGEPGEDSFGAVTTAAAQRRLRIVAFGVAPAVATGAMAADRLGGVGAGVIVAASVVVVILLMGRRRLPLHLMPLASAVVNATAPVIGLALALLVFSLAGRPIEITDLIVPLVGAWSITAYGLWVVARFDSMRRVRVATVDSPGLAFGLEQEFEAASIRSYKMLGWLADGPITAGADARCLGSLEDLREITEEYAIELLVFSSGVWSTEEKSRRSRLELFDHVAGTCLDLPVRLLEAIQLYENLLGHVPLGQANAAWFQYLLHPRFRGGSQRAKRAFDVVVAGAMLIVALPALIAFAVAVKLTDGGPIFYRQRRVGEGGREFQMIKLRSMLIESERVGPQWSSADDDRITSVGRIMRRFHIDEMPQLWNVLCGEMTIVGPRPERPELIVELEQRLSYYDRRHLVKPGLAGWAQARCGYSGSEEGTSWKLCHDLYYLKHRSIYFDSLILLENFRVALRGGVQFGLAVPQQQFIIGG
jgi:lipopolysaccharide/colanic/teichoic acid biosynthesis glycosyltransferase